MGMGIREKGNKPSRGITILFT